MKRTWLESIPTEMFGSAFRRMTGWLRFVADKGFTLSCIEVKSTPRIGPGKGRKHQHPGLLRGVDAMLGKTFTAFD